MLKFIYLFGFLLYFEKPFVEAVLLVIKYIFLCSNKKWKKEVQMNKTKQ